MTHEARGLHAHKNIIRHVCDGCGLSFAQKHSAELCEKEHVNTSVIQNPPADRASPLGSEAESALWQTARLGAPTVESDGACTDYAEAAASLLEHYAKLLRGGTAPSDIGPLVALLGRVIAHST